ncbi:hypothetical protein [Nostoc sp.]
MFLVVFRRSLGRLTIAQTTLSRLMEALESAWISGDIYLFIHKNKSPG